MNAVQQSVDYEYTKEIEKIDKRIRTAWVKDNWARIDELLEKRYCLQDIQKRLNEAASESTRTL